MDFSLLGFHGLRGLYNVHPVFVHFPIALFPFSLLLYALSLKANWGGLRPAARLTLVLSTLSAIVTVGTGLWAEDSFPHNDTVHHIMQTHKTMGYGIITSGVILALWSFWGRGCRPRFFAGFMGGLVFVCVVVLLSADLGGRMVFLEGAAVRPTILPPSHNPPAPHDHKEHRH